jgi:type I restriction enzyme, R subunit
MERIRHHLRENLSIQQDHFDIVPALSDAGGWGAAKRTFGEARLRKIVGQLNEAIAA